ncbi:MAG: DinB family protein, partial [Treponema sp.]|nr:DinB family protein [Treponema sp.]
MIIRLKGPEGRNMFRHLAKYNKESNEKMNAVIKTLTEEEWNRQFSGFFKSIHELCSHVYFWDYVWLGRLASVKSFKSFDGSYFGKEYAYNELLFKNIDGYLIKRPD